MIGLFDSGIGGLTVVHELLRQAPHAPFVYLGDTARTPYGNKSSETIQRYAIEDVEFLLSHGASVIVVACNTASALAAKVLRERYPRVPIFEVIEPAVEEALRVTRGRVGVIGTRATIDSRIHELELLARRPTLSVEAQACPLFVPLVEEGWLDDPETKRIARRYLSRLRREQIDTLILGCTHYPLLAPVIQHAIGSRVHLIDSAKAVIRNMLSTIDIPAQVSDPTQSFFLTDRSACATTIAAHWLGRPVSFQLAELHQI